MPKKPVRPGDTPFTKLVFTNNRTNAVKVTIVGKVQGGTPEQALMDCPASVATTWEPPKGSTAWKNIYEIAVTIMKSASPNPVVGNVSCSTPAPVPPDPRALASSATCDLNPYNPQGFNNCTLKLLDADGVLEASATAVVLASA